MNGWRGVALVVGGFWALSGCYRSRELPLAEVRALSTTDQGGLQVARGAKQKTWEFESYDTVEVQTADDTGYEFENPVSARVASETLFVSDAYAQRSFHLEEVEAIEVSEAAPGRPWIIAGVALGSLVLGAVVGSQSVDCHSDLCGLERTFWGMVGGTIGLGAGLAISIPITAKLNPKGREPAPPTRSPD